MCRYTYNPYAFNVNMFHRWLPVLSFICFVTPIIRIRFQNNVITENTCLYHIMWNILWYFMIFMYLCIWWFRVRIIIWNGSCIKHKHSDCDNISFAKERMINSATKESSFVEVCCYERKYGECLIFVVNVQNIIFYIIYSTRDINLLIC